LVFIIIITTIKGLFIITDSSSVRIHYPDKHISESETCPFASSLSINENAKHASSHCHLYIIERQATCFFTLLFWIVK